MKPLCWSVHGCSPAQNGHFALRPEQTPALSQLKRIAPLRFKTGLSMDSFPIQAGFTIEGIPAGTERGLDEIVLTFW